MKEDPRITLAMHRALEAIAGGATIAEAAILHGVSLHGLYRAMKRTGSGKRCPTCNRLLPHSVGDAIEVRIRALEAAGMTRTEAQAEIEANDTRAERTRGTQAE